MGACGAKAVLKECVLFDDCHVHNFFKRLDTKNTLLFPNNKAVGVTMYVDPDAEDEYFQVPAETTAAKTDVDTEYVGPPEELFADSKVPISVEINGKHVHKRTLCKNVFALKPRSTDTLKRVRYVPRYIEPEDEGLQQLGLQADSVDNMFCLKDPFCCIVKTFSSIEQRFVA